MSSLNIYIHYQSRILDTCIFMKSPTHTCMLFQLGRQYANILTRFDALKLFVVLTRNNLYCDLF